MVLREAGNVLLNRVWIHVGHATLNDYQADMVLYGRLNLLEFYGFQFCMPMELAQNLRGKPCSPAHKNSEGPFMGL